MEMQLLYRDSTNISDLVIVSVLFEGVECNNTEDCKFFHSNFVER